MKFINFFKADISKIPCPDAFTNPFNYEPHALCKIATTELQDKLGKHVSKGRMYGVLIVETPKQGLAYLAAASGNQTEESNIAFVPPVYDVTQPDGFFKKGEQELIYLNKNIEFFENSEELKLLKQNLATIKETSGKEIADFKQRLKDGKKEREFKRNNIINNSNIDNKELLLEELIKSSKTQKSSFSKLKKQWKAEIQNCQNALDDYQDKIEDLKGIRKNKSAILQRKLFEHYNFINGNKTYANLLEIFEQTDQKVPPAAAGDCAAPKLLQFAFANNLKPIAMAEFWWGPSPKSEIRKHGYYYPACNSKCKPILGFMLQGLNVEKSTTVPNDLNIEVVFEDEHLAVINKPAGLLSVPGKEEAESVFTKAKQLYPQATGPIIVHRLDMATSGLMLIAKTKTVHENLQKQFLEKTVQKRYVASLDGEIREDEGFIELPLRVDLNDRPRQLVCYEYGKPAKTKFKVVDRKDGKTRIHFFPITGRTHQLRVHAAHHLGLDTPIIGDELYGKKANRLHLHAESISFIHPVAERKMTFTQKAAF